MLCSRAPSVPKRPNRRESVLSRLRHDSRSICFFFLSPIDRETRPSRPSAAAAPSRCVRDAIWRVKRNGKTKTLKKSVQTKQRIVPRRGRRRAYSRHLPARALRRRRRRDRRGGGSN